MGVSGGGKWTVTSSRRIRRSYEAGHTPKLLVLVDDALDCGKAVYYTQLAATGSDTRSAAIPGRASYMGVLSHRQRSRHIISRHGRVVPNWSSASWITPAVTSFS